ncbi:DNA-binding NarL/FixJ family response regulator [Kineococcus xinjiangensis]|uniref:DNA-binding NarL/FixJ family response regulator n=1 Tax=Kineococcus xinjiangensis TaxID=512762 RepID=A0A2S6IPG5_9ACTN|nr:response regulator transcription factor [Kineococcus xinjiangensis]PPK96147.1 DNA-binding NarL/FixJ family response regulator [Kineococcus xinjiangensis]
MLLADDQPLVRAGLAMLLDAEPGLDVVGEVGDGRGVLDRLAELRPDVVLMDLRMPGMNGLEATRRLTADPPPEDPDRIVRVIILTTYHVGDEVYAALRAGASGFVLKDAAPDELVAAIRAVAAGEAWLDPAIARRLLDDFAAHPPSSAEASARLDVLTSREREVLALLAHGLSSDEIAAHLFIGGATVKTHLARVLMKLGLRDRAHAVTFAYRTGLVHPGDPAPPPRRPGRA